MHKRKLEINSQIYFYHISPKTLCIWYPDNSKKVIDISGNMSTCSRGRLISILLRNPCGVKITPSLIKNIIVNNKHSIKLESVKAHTCPLKMEIHGDMSLCKCCENCKHECAMNI